MITGMAGHFQHQWAAFDADAFVATASNDLESLELKARSQQIEQAMLRYMPDDFAQAGEIMRASLAPALNGDIFGQSVNEAGIAGWAIMPMADYVGLYGQSHFNLSMSLLKTFTSRFSSEFGIRFFLLQQPKQTLAVLKQWTGDVDRHVRRLASEGSRPRLPWAMQLPALIADPTPVVELLELLKDDENAYVRRSVANHLNDIAKDHPSLVIDIAARWMQGAGKARQALLRHACRTLIKQGDRRVLQLFGFHPPLLAPVSLELQTPNVVLGSALQFSIIIRSNAAHEQALMVDYIIHHRRANGNTSPKVFKWRKLALQAKASRGFTKNHAIRPITTRVYYPGLHRLEVVVNGVSLATVGFQLLMPD